MTEEDRGGVRGDRRQKTRDGRQEMGDRSWETGDERQKMGDVS